MTCDVGVLFSFTVKPLVWESDFHIIYWRYSVEIQEYYDSVKTVVLGFHCETIFIATFFVITKLLE